MEIDKAQYDKLKEFGADPKKHGFMHAIPWRDEQLHRFHMGCSQLRGAAPPG
jgi:hypothetical protein